MVVVDCPKTAVLFCVQDQHYHLFFLDEERKCYVPAVETLIPESLLDFKNRCSQEIDVRTLMVQYSTQELHGVHELLLPRVRL